MRVLILGAGAVGGYIGARLLTAGAHVFFLARGQRLEALAYNGLVVRSPLGDFSGQVEAARAPPSGFAPDVVVLACKAPALDAAVEAIAPHITERTRVLPILNGVAHLDTLHQRLPHASILGGLTHGALTLRDDGTIDHLTPFFAMICGAVPSQSDAVAASLVELLAKAGVDAHVSDKIRQDMWNKYVFLTTLAGATCLMRASIGTIMEADDGEDFVLGLLAENLAVARAEGFAPDEASMASYKRSLTERGSTFTSSMLRDVLSGRRTEADHILGDMLRRARQHGLDTPRLRLANAHLQCHEATLA